MKQVDNNEAAYHVAWLLHQLDNAHPDVGMPPGLDYHISQARFLLGLDEADIDRLAIFKRMNRK